MTKQIIQNYKICILDEKGMPKYYLLFVASPNNNNNNINVREFFSNLEWDYILKNQDLINNFFKKKIGKEILFKIKN